MIKRLLPGFMTRFGERLRFPYLFLLLAVTFIVDLFVPDLIPFVDEIVLGLGTMVLARWKKQKSLDEGSV